MNAALMIAYQNLELTKAAVASVLAQDIPGGVHLWLIDNGSTDGTWSWMLNELDRKNLYLGRCAVNSSPVAITNRELATIYALGYNKIFGVPNDVVLPPNLFRELDRWPRGIVTASQTDHLDFPRFESASAVSECTPMAVALIRRWAWQALIAKDGYFLDEGMFHYASDCDLALRMAACGIRGVQLNIQYYHFCSAAHRLASSEDGQRQRQQADLDRGYFLRKWGFAVNDAEYGARCGDVNFRGERVS